jgi:hypothetical protein
MQAGRVVSRAHNKSLQVSRDCVSFIKPLFSQVVATRAAPSSSTSAIANGNRMTREGTNLK